MCDIFSRYAWELCMEPPLWPQGHDEEKNFAFFLVAQVTYDVHWFLIQIMIYNVCLRLLLCSLIIILSLCSSLFEGPACPFPWTRFKCLLDSSVPSPKGMLLFVLEMKTTLHLIAFFELKSSISYIRQSAVDGWLQIQGLFLPILPQWSQRRASSFPSAKGRGKRAERVWPQTVLPRSVSPEETQGRGGILQWWKVQHCWLASRDDSEHKLQKSA